MPDSRLPVCRGQPAQRLTARQAPCRCRRSSARDYFVCARPDGPQRRVRRILAAAPVENRPYPFHTTDSASWKNPHTSVRYSGMRPPLPHFISIPNSSEAVRATSNPQASSDGRTSSGWRQGLPSGRVQLPFGTVDARSDVGERASAVLPFHLQQPTFEPLPFGQDQASRFGDRESRLLGRDSGRDEQRRAVTRDVLLHIEPERRASPAAAVVAALPAIAAHPFGVAEAGDVCCGGQFRREIPGGVSKRMIHAAKL